MTTVLLSLPPGPLRDAIAAHLVRLGHAVRTADDVLAAAADLLADPADVVVYSDAAAAAASAIAADPRGVRVARTPAVVLTDDPAHVPDAELDVRGVLVVDGLSLADLADAVRRAADPAWAAVRAAAPGVGAAPN
jgi:hypothetical protein